MSRLAGFSWQDRALLWHFGNICDDRVRVTMRNGLRSGIR
jgi:hypothetical protein